MGIAQLALAASGLEDDQALDGDYQQRVSSWLVECFGKDVALDKQERLHRFLEEALELAQAGGCSRREAELLLNYVFSRPIGHVDQEVGGVLVTLAGVCQAQGISMKLAGDRELARNQSRTAEIRVKRAKKPRGSPLPQ